MRLEYLLLEEKIKEIAGNGPVYYLPNQGNWGDGLIRMGTLKFFNDIGLEYEELRNNKFDWILPCIKGGTAIYGGGGAWCKYWDFGYYYTQKLSKRFNVIVLPSTYDQLYSFPNTTFFSRDKFQSMESIPNSLFCHDMALYLDKMEVQKGSGTGYFYRTDKESSGKLHIPENNIDISTKGSHLSDLYPFFEELSKYEVIYTDRLHVSIAACLLGKEVHLYQGSYFKIKAIYESSIKDYFENVHFHEDYST
jgi:exopolysaccharide biosynthesis predicted pyruvyltransferase EpsI